MKYLISYAILLKTYLHLTFVELTPYFSVCAFGKRICISKKCPEGHADMFKRIKDNKSPIDYIEYDDSEGDSEEDEEDIYDEEYPKDDPDVQDINWF